MNNLNKITKVLGLTLVLAASSNALAATVNSTATVEVKNIVTLTEDATLNFGSVRATADDSNVANFATLLLNPADGTLAPVATAVGTSALTSLSAGNPGTYTISDAANFTPMTLTLPAAATTLIASGVPATTPTFTVDDWTATVSGGPNDGTDAETATNLTTDATGAVTFNVGATLSTIKSAAGTATAYLDANYEGSYAIKVEY